MHAQIVPEVAKDDMVRSKNQCRIHNLPANRASFIAVMCVVLLAGCSPTETDKIAGKWVIQDVGAISKKVGGEDEPSAGEAKMSVRFERSGRLTTTTAIGEIDSTKNGSWKVLIYDPEQSAITVECMLQGQTTEHEIEFKDDQTIMWVPPNMAGTTKKLRFVRSSN